ncbi:MAG: hypothetical protein WCB27_15235 [Thermoguttaceae bacterium]
MNQKLAEARILAARKMPYMTHQVMALIPVERPGLGTMAVDEYCRMYFDPAFLEGRDLKHLAFVVLHEAIHGGGGTDMAAMIVTACEERPAPKAILVVADRYTGWPPKPVGPRVVACLTQAGTAESVPKWIDAVVLNPED